MPIPDPAPFNAPQSRRAQALPESSAALSTPAGAQCRSGAVANAGANWPACENAGVLSRGIQKIAHLDILLGAKPIAQNVRQVPSCERLLAWGLKPSSERAQAYAQKHSLPLIRLEDGFCRSVGLGSEAPPLSVVADDLGIYYNANEASRLECLIGHPVTAEQTQRALALQALWQAQRVSKYNHLREYAQALPADYVLVIDQTLGDASIAYGQASADSFAQMLNCALAENPNSTVVVKIHPDVFAGKKKGHFNIAALQKMPRVQVLAQDVHPVRLIECAQKLYVVTSQMGFEGLLWNKPVRTFGMPFYAGWGLTDDELPAPARRTQGPAPSLAQLIHAALIAYPHYLNPETLTRCEAETVVQWIGLQRRMRTRSSEKAFALHISRRKRPILRKFLEGSQLQFVRSLKKVPAGATVAVWGRKLSAAQEAQACAKNLQLLRIEDGFIRSVGLGADLVQPLSWAIDNQGIYYDATQPSALEHTLQNHRFETPLLERAQALRQQLIASGITKYNVGHSPWLRPETAQGQTVVLVPGQVESDASLKWGTHGIRTNLALLQAARKARPNAYIVYKPHPDVVAKLREPGNGEAQALSYCNAVVTDAAMHQLLTQVDEVHVLTSLTGFEALLRGIPVCVYGCPFYAGWGLTDDQPTWDAGQEGQRAPREQPHPTLARRQRKLQLDELVAGALILYPTYISRVTNHYTTPEQVLQELVRWREAQRTQAPPKTALAQAKAVWSGVQLRVKRWVLAKIR